MESFKAYQSRPFYHCSTTVVRKEGAEWGILHRKSHVLRRGWECAGCEGKVPCQQAAVRRRYGGPDVGCAHYCAESPGWGRASVAVCGC
jgi:hypothetical protein